jgi:hypothetical protein
VPIDYGDAPASSVLFGKEPLGDRLGKADDMGGALAKLLAKTLRGGHVLGQLCNANLHWSDRANSESDGGRWAGSSEASSNALELAKLCYFQADAAKSGEGIDRNDPGVRRLLHRPPKPQWAGGAESSRSAIAQVSKTPSWPRSWANLSLF